MPFDATRNSHHSLESARTVRTPCLPQHPLPHPSRLPRDAIPRAARLVRPDCPTTSPCDQVRRSNNRQDIFFADDDRELCLRLLTEQLQLHGVRLVVWCLMTNHVHLVLVPTDPPHRLANLENAVGRTHWRYAQTINRPHGRSGISGRAAPSPRRWTRGTPTPQCGTSERNPVRANPRWPRPPRRALSLVRRQGPLHRTRPPRARRCGPLGPPPPARGVADDPQAARRRHDRRGAPQGRPHRPAARERLVPRQARSRRRPPAPPPVAPPAARKAAEAGVRSKGPGSRTDDRQRACRENGGCPYFHGGCPSFSLRSPSAPEREGLPLRIRNQVLPPSRNGRNHLRPICSGVMYPECDQ